MAAPFEEAASSSDESEHADELAEELDFCSPKFNPLLALKSEKIVIPVTGVRSFSSLSEYEEAVTRRRQGQGKIVTVPSSSRSRSYVKAGPSSASSKNEQIGLIKEEFENFEAKHERGRSRSSNNSSITSERKGSNSEKSGGTGSVRTRVRSNPGVSDQFETNVKLEISVETSLEAIDFKCPSSKTSEHVLAKIKSEGKSRVETTDFIRPTARISDRHIDTKIKLETPEEKRKQHAKDFRRRPSSSPRVREVNPSSVSRYKEDKFRSLSTPRGRQREDDQKPSSSFVSKADKHRIPSGSRTISGFGGDKQDVRSRDSVGRGQSRMMKGDDRSNKASRRDGDIPIPSKMRGNKDLRNVFTRMDDMEGPLSFLTRCVNNKEHVRVVTRGAVTVSSICRGYIVAFDKYFNMAMIDVDEIYRRPAVLGKVRSRISHKLQAAQETLNKERDECQLRWKAQGKENQPVPGKGSTDSAVSVSTDIETEKSSNAPSAASKTSNTAKETSKEDKTSSSQTTKTGLRRLASVYVNLPAALSPYEREALMLGIPDENVEHRHISQLLLRGENVVSVSIIEDF